MIPLFNTAATPNPRLMFPVLVLIRIKPFLLAFDAKACADVTPTVAKVGLFAVNAVLVLTVPVTVALRFDAVACATVKLPVPALAVTVPDTGWVAGKLLTDTDPLTGCVAGKLLTDTEPDMELSEDNTTRCVPASDAPVPVATAVPATLVKFVS